MCFHGMGHWLAYAAGGADACDIAPGMDKDGPYLEERGYMDGDPVPATVLNVIAGAALSLIFDPRVQLPPTKALEQASVCMFLANRMDLCPDYAAKLASMRPTFPEIEVAARTAMLWGIAYRRFINILTTHILRKLHEPPALGPVYLQGQFIRHMMPGHAMLADMAAKPSYFVTEHSRLELVRFAMELVATSTIPEGPIQ